MTFTFTLTLQIQRTSFTLYYFPLGLVPPKGTLFSSAVVLFCFVFFSKWSLSRGLKMASWAGGSRNLLDEKEKKALRGNNNKNKQIQICWEKKGRQQASLTGSNSLIIKSTTQSASATALFELDCSVIGKGCFLISSWWWLLQHHRSWEPAGQGVCVQGSPLASRDCRQSGSCQLPELCVKMKNVAQKSGNPPEPSKF